MELRFNGPGRKGNPPIKEMISGSISHFPVFLSHEIPWSEFPLYIYTYLIYSLIYIGFTSHRSKMKQLRKLQKQLPPQQRLSSTLSSWPSRKKWRTSKWHGISVMPINRVRININIAIIVSDTTILHSLKLRSNELIHHKLEKWWIYHLRLGRSIVLSKSLKRD